MNCELPEKMSDDNSHGAPSRAERARQLMRQMQHAASDDAQQVLNRTAHAADTDAQPSMAELPDQSSAAGAHAVAVSVVQDTPGSAQNEASAELDAGGELDASGAPLCWICRDPDSEEPLVAPCQCRGSLRGVHASCLEAWITQRNQRAMRDQSGQASSNPLLSNPRCDLCRAPLQVVHRPAGRRDFFSVHWVQCRQNILPKIVQGVLLYLAMVLLVFMYAYVVNDGLDNLLSKHNRWLWILIFVFLFVFCWLSFLAELLLVWFSYPWSVRAPRNRLLRRYFHYPGARWRPFVLGTWYHLYCVPIINVLTTIINQDRERDLDPVRWCLLVPICIIPFLPHLKGFLRSSEFCSRRGLLQWMRNWQRTGREICRTCNRRCCLAMTRDFCRAMVHPMLPWLQLLEAFVFGVIMVADIGAQVKIDIASVVMCSLGLTSSVIALLAMFFRGPQHSMFLISDHSTAYIHFAWWCAALCLVYFALLTVCAATDGFEKQPPIGVNWTILVVTGSAWIGVVLVLAVYSNTVLCFSYCQNWRLQHGEAHIVGAAVVQESV